jgi:molecular chaperone DnaK
MRKDAEAHAEDDKKRREEIEQRNEADTSVYRSEKMLKDNAEKISGADKSKIEEAVKEVKEAIKGSDAAAIRTASEKLNEAWQAVSAELYKAAAEKARAEKAQGQPGPGPEAGSEPQGDGKKGKEEGPIIDAEVVEEKK